MIKSLNIWSGFSLPGQGVQGVHGFSTIYKKKKKCYRGEMGGRPGQAGQIAFLV